MGASRNTRQKKVLESFVKDMERMFSSESLYKKAKKKDTSLGIATVYRFLREKVSLGELYAYQCDRRTVYSVKKRSHCHYICEKTGKVVHFDVDNIDFLRKKIPGSISSFQIEVRGVCEDCDT